MSTFRLLLDYKRLWLKILWLTTLDIVSISFSLYAQNLSPGHVKFHHLTIEQGLSHNCVYAILQDHKGFMWFGTYDGLVKYDGYECTIYKHDPDNPTSLSHNAVWALYEDRAGTLWIGTVGGGLNRFDRDTEQFHRYLHDPDNPYSLSNDMVRTIYEDRSGILWIGTSGGLNKFERDTEQFHCCQYKPIGNDSLSYNQLLSIYEDRSGVFWIGGENGLYQFDRKTEHFIRYQHDPNDPQSLSFNRVNVIYENHLGELWIVTEGGGLNRFDRKTEQFYRYQHDPTDPRSLSSNNLNTMTEDYLGRLWIGTVDQGLNRFDHATGHFIRYQHDPTDPKSLNDNQIRSLYVDRAGTLWIGTKTGGISTLNRRSELFCHYCLAPDNPLSSGHNVVYAIHEDHTGALWIGTEGGGLILFDRSTGEITQYLPDPENPYSLSNNKVRSLYEDHSGVLWIGTREGLNRLDRDTGQFVHYQHSPDDPQSISDNVIYAIYEDQFGKLWVGTYNGLNSFDRSTTRFTRYQHDPDDPWSLSHHAITVIYEDRSGTLWVGTRKGLNQFDHATKRFIRYYPDPTNPNSLSHDYVKSIHEDRSGILWIGTAGGGLNKFDRTNKIFTHYREKDGLPNDLIYGILEDGNGNLWFSTNQGLSKFNPRINTFTNYDLLDGLQGNEFNTNAYCQTRDGMMLFGGFNGLNAFYPEDINENPYIPPIVLTNFYLFNKLVAIGSDSPLQKAIEETEALTLAYWQNVFAFEFAALNYVIPQKNKYAYKLEGFDQEWNYVNSKRRFAPYANLPAGEYVFKVQGSNNDGVWNKEGVSIRITITPPWWKTWWFQGSLIVLAIGLIFGGYQWRVNSIKARSRQLELQVAERTQALQQEIAERKQIEEFLRESEERFRTIVETAPSILNITDSKGNNIYVSPNCKDITGYSQEELKGRMCWWVHGDDSASANEIYNQAYNQGISGKNFEYKASKKNGEVWYASSSWEPVKDKEGNLKGLVMQTVDITERKRAEEQLKASLREKEILLKEIHHRVKNNLQVVSSLLKFQAERVQDSQTLNMFKDCQHRIRSMALIHESLYQSKNLAKIDFVGYVRNLTTSLLHLYETQSAGITMLIEIDKVDFDIDTAITCGLIINELISNALKYAFPKDKYPCEGDGIKKAIHIALRSSGERQWQLIISDTGVGFPKEIDFRATDSLGLQLVGMLTKQLKGTIELGRIGGTTFTITFPVEELEERS